MSSRFPDDAEWLEADGLGGFASGTVRGLRTRRYHALLVAATTPPTGRFVLVNGFDAFVETAAGRFALSCQRYTPDVVHPDGIRRITGFDYEPWPTWTFTLEDGTRIEQEIIAAHGAPLVGIRWRVRDAAANHRIVLSVRPFLSGRDYHALHHENGAFAFAPTVVGERLEWRPYDGVPPVIVTTNGRYRHAPEWYRTFLYVEERARGLDDTEDLAAPGVFEFDLARDAAVCLLATEPPTSDAGAVAAAIERGGVHEAGNGAPQPATAMFAALRGREQARRARFATPLHRAADAYVVRRGTDATIIAGYPWFTDWGRDTFIALRGLCIATGRLDDARAMLIGWADTVSNGMLPNRFPDCGDAPEYNAVDASLWFVVAVGELRASLAARDATLDPRDARTLDDAVEAIIAGYARGTRYGLHVDDDGLIAAGAPGVQLTWMDAKVGDWVVTPRIGKPVEVQALWLAALHVAGASSDRWRPLATRALRSFGARFWDERRGCLYDVVDVDHVAGTIDASFRPNQILAVGGLPVMLLDPERARRVVDAVETRLLTPLGLRTLAPDDPRYVRRYEGDRLARDGGYHQGATWPWLAGPFIDAWLRVRGMTPLAKAEARRRFITPLRAHLAVAGLGHVSELADGDAPHTPRGCPFQAWSLGELLRLEQSVLAADAPHASAVIGERTYESR